MKECRHINFPTKNGKFQVMHCFFSLKIQCTFCQFVWLKMINSVCWAEPTIHLASLKRDTTLPCRPCQKNKLRKVCIYLGLNKLWGELSCKFSSSKYPNLEVIELAINRSLTELYFGLGNNCHIDFVNFVKLLSHPTQIIYDQYRVRTNILKPEICLILKR